MREIWRTTLRARRARSSRAVRRSFGPRSEPLEDRALMALFPGNPLPEPLTQFTGVGTTDATTQLNMFKAATASTGGNRTINWHGVTLDGTTAPHTPPTLPLTLLPNT